MVKRIWKWIAVIVVSVWSLMPVYWFLKLAFQTPAEIARFPPLVYPPNPQLAAFYNTMGHEYVVPATGQVLLASGQANQIVQGLINSFVLALVVTAITMTVVVPLAYVFARLEFKHKTKLLMAVLLSVALPPVSTLIPFYTLFIQVGLAGTRLGLVIITLTITIPFVTWMLIGFFRNLPPIERLARVDGYSRLGAFVKIMIPMAKGGIAVGAVIAFLFAWNEYTFAVTLVNGTPATTLPASISGFLHQHPEPAHLAASVMYSLVPPFIVAYFLQRHITEMNIVDPIR